MKTIAPIVLAVLALSILTGCPQPVPPPVPAGEAPDYEYQLPPGVMGLQKCKPEEVPDFAAACQDLAGLRQAVQYSIDYMGKASSQQAYARYGPEFTHARGLASLQAFAAMLDGNPSPGQMNQALRDKFDVYTSIGWNRRGDGNEAV